MSLLNSRCPVCKTKDNLLRCQGCKVMLYCSRDHQVVHRRDHKRECNSVKNSRNTLEHEERELRAMPPDFMMPANVFEECVGHFWTIYGTRDYIRARFSVVDSLVKIKTFSAVQEAFDHIMDMLRLCRGDNMGLRFMAPALFLRLGKDQECYDFIKWYATTGSRGDYDWGDMSLPFLDVRNADVFEPVELFIKKFGELSHALALFLLKLRLLRDVKSLQNSIFLYDRVPPEMVNRIRKELVGTIVAQNSYVINSNNQKQLIKKLELQLKQLYIFVKKSNTFFWSALLNPDDYLAAPPSAYSMGSEEHAQLILQYSYDAWVETPGSIDMIREFVQDD